MSQTDNHSIEKIVEVRSFLANNLDVLLDNLNVRKQASKNQSEDLFDFGSDESEEKEEKIPWKKEINTRSLLEVMIQEKEESLGLYVSGNPLKNYQNFADWVSYASGRGDIHLVLLNKTKKIFTKSGKLMLALNLSMLSGEYEGIVFPKKALELAPKLQDKELFWVRGKILEKQKKKEDEITSVEGEMENGEAPEYEEAPKIAVDDIIKFENGILELIPKEENLSYNRQSMLQSVDWSSIKIQPQKFEDYLDKNSNTTHTNTRVEAKTLKLPQTLGHEKLRDIKNILTAQPRSEKDVLIKLEVETKEGWKTAKGEFWINPVELKKIWER